MTAIEVVAVDVYVLRGHGEGAELLVLRRAPGERSPGSWESVHGHVEPGETPHETALRELAEETALVPDALYNLSRCESFYLHRRGQIALLPAFVARVGAHAAFRLSAEHDAGEWLALTVARERVSWPRMRRAIEDLAALFVDDRGAILDDVLRIC